MSTIGEFLKQKRVEAGMSQSLLAEKLGYDDRVIIWRKETGKINFSLADLITFAGLLNVKLSELFVEYENNGS